MDKDPTAISVRLTKTQMRLIWTGLDFICLSYQLQQEGKEITSAYPFRLYPLPTSCDRGTFSSAMMNRLLALRTRLELLAGTGGEVALNAIEVRAVILSARAYLGWRRKRARDERRKDAQTKRRRGVDKESIGKLRNQTQRVIKSLERAMKRANRRFIKVLSRAALEGESKEWQAHIRWMKYNILYFKPLPSVVPGDRRRQRLQIDQMVAVAEAGLRDQDYELPGKEELRRMMRMFAQYSRRGRMGEFHHQYVVTNPESSNAQLVLVDFLEKRLNLKRLQDEPVMGRAQEAPESAQSAQPPAPTPTEKPRRRPLKLTPELRQWLGEIRKRRPASSSPPAAGSKRP